MKIYQLLITVKNLDIRETFNKLNKLFGLEMEATSLLPKRLIAVIILGIFQQILHINGLIQVYPDAAKICNSLCLYIVVMQLVAAFINKYLNNDIEQQKHIMNIINEFYCETEKFDEFLPVLKSFVKYAKMFIEKSTVLYFIVLSTPSVSGFLLSLTSQEFVYAMSIYLPFIDHESLIGFLINSFSFLIFTVVFGILLVITIEVHLLYVIQAIPMARIICMKISNLKIKLNDQSRFTLLSKYEENINLLLVDIIKDHNRYYNFFEDINSHSSFQTFVILSLNTVGLGMSIIIARYSSFLIGVSFFLCFAYQCAIHCVLASIIDRQNQEIREELIDFPWFELSRNNQKIFLQFIHCCQNMGNVNMVIFGKIDLGLFTHIMNAAYSYLMFVLNFIDK